MKQEGMAGSIQVDLDDFMSKEFVTFRKTKNYSEIQYSTKYRFVNFVNKHFTRRQDDILNQVSPLLFRFNLTSSVNSKYPRESIKPGQASSSTSTTSTSLSKSWNN